jgi:hypothetical protein
MISRISLVFVSLLLAVLVFAQTGGKDIPTFDGDDNPDHNGQPKWCQSSNQGGFKANCGKCNPPTCDEKGNAIHYNNPKCGVNCRPNACLCHPGCNLTGHLRRKMNKLEQNYREAGR